MAYIGFVKNICSTESLHDSTNLCSQPQPLLSSWSPSTFLSLLHDCSLTCCLGSSSHFFVNAVRINKSKPLLFLIAAATATVEGKMSKPLKKLMKKVIASDAQEELAVSDAKLGNVIKVLDQPNLWIDQPFWYFC